jgi:hypothetical protein
VYPAKVVYNCSKDYDKDFLGFSFNEIDSIKDLGIIRTSDSSRFNKNLNLGNTDETANANDIDGTYLFDT